MSLGIAIKAPEGIVLAAESRVTLQAPIQQGQTIHVNFDNATKLLSFSDPNTHVGAVTYGMAAIGFRTAHSFMPEFEASLPPTRLPILDFASRLSDFFMSQWGTAMPMPPDYSGPDMSFVVGGFNDNEPYGRIYLFGIPRSPLPVEQNPHPNFGITWGGQREFVDRILQGFDSKLPKIIEQALGLSPVQMQQMMDAIKSLMMNLPLIAMPLQDCVDLAIFFIKTTVDAQKLTVGIRGCGGPIDVARITKREGIKFVQRKEITGQT